MTPMTIALANAMPPINSSKLRLRRRVRKIASHVDRRRENCVPHLPAGRVDACQRAFELTAGIEQGRL